MEFSRIYLNRLHNLPPAHDTVVVIDVLRSFTTAAVALARGARAIHAVEGLTAALALAAAMPRAVTVGAVGGGAPAPGFTFGNSPEQLLGADVAGRDVILSTAAGVCGLQRFGEARQVFAASLVCARATARAIQASGSARVCFVITGEWIDRDGDEDVACADYLEAMLCGASPAAEGFARRVRESDFGRRFGDSASPHLVPADLAIASDADRFDFAMPVVREAGHLVIHRN